METLRVRTTQREQMIDVTGEVAATVKRSGVSDGVVWLHCPHTTAALIVQENTDPDLRDDILGHLKKLVPQPGFRHGEGNADAHIKAALLGTTQPILVDGGRLVLGTWQAIWFVELDGPRDRQILARVTAA